MRISRGYQCKKFLPGPLKAISRAGGVGTQKYYFHSPVWINNGKAHIGMYRYNDNIQYVTIHWGSRFSNLARFGSVFGSVGW